MVNKRVKIENNLINGPSTIEPPQPPTSPTMPTSPTSPTVPAGPDLLYVANNNSNSVSVIDTDLESVIANISGFNGPTFLAADVNLGNVYVTNYFGSSLGIIDANSNNLVNTITLPGNLPNGVGVNPTNNRVYVTSNPRNVTEIDGTTETITTTVETNTGSPQDVVISETLQRLYVPISGNDQLEVFNSASLVRETIITGLSPQGYQANINPVTNRVYVASLSGGLSVVDGASNTVITVVPLGAQVTDVDVNVRTNMVYAVSQNVIYSIDGTNNQIVEQLQTPGNLRGIRVNSDKNVAYVTQQSLNNVLIIDLASNDIVAQIPVGQNPFGIEFIQT
ncbi:YncE family protein [Geomicrobium sp. JCM 19055]|uniref:YncE family protein n=1 Tax=Geomicrobium sp. JCM 19055 TaxID=1460649 RepID=UPI00045ED96E|nr:YncE family protein [Geomicrobium sp. JCM 19055]GAJ98936.1 hypothetical protein JCM19055_1903 [Geomicrobium sp. JCM 19055]